MARQTFAPGFRLSAFDVVALALGGVTAAAAGTVDRWTGLAIAFAVGHFFLFCNVLRMSRPLELVWAVTFAALAVAAGAFGAFAWPIVFATSAGLTVLLAVIESRRPSYHGVGWRTINPGLPEWWRERNDGVAK